MSVDLKPCPMCGGKAQCLVDDDGDNGVFCQRCSLSTDWYGHKQDAVAAWNRRVPAGGEVVPSWDRECCKCGCKWMDAAGSDCPRCAGGEVVVPRDVLEGWAKQVHLAATCSSMHLLAGEMLDRATPQPYNV